MTAPTADSITDDQIRALRDIYLAERNIVGVDTCDVALGRHGASRSPKRVARARARCAEILSRRSTQTHAEKKTARQLDDEIAEALAGSSGAADTDLLAVLARNPGLTEANLRSYLRGEHGASSALDRAIAAGRVVRRGHKLYRAEDAP